MQSFGKFIVTFLIIFLAGLVTNMIIMTKIGHKYEHISRLAVCEKSLPRDQVCELIAVPLERSVDP